MYFLSNPGLGKGTFCLQGRIQIYSQKYINKHAWSGLVAWMVHDIPVLNYFTTIVSRLSKSLGLSPYFPSVPANG